MLCPLWDDFIIQNRQDVGVWGVGLKQRPHFSDVREIPPRRQQMALLARTGDSAAARGGQEGGAAVPLGREGGAHPHKRTQVPETSCGEWRPRMGAKPRGRLSDSESSGLLQEI